MSVCQGRCQPPAEYVKGLPLFCVAFADTDKEDMDFDEDLLSDDENEENKTYRVPPAKNRPGGKDREISLEQLRTVRAFARNKTW